MNKEKLKKELSQLCIGQSPEKLVKKYYKKKYKEMMIIIIVGLFIVASSIYKDISDSTLGQDNGIYRNNSEEGKETIILQIKKGDDEWEEIEFDLYPKEYSKEELEVLFLEVSGELEERIKNKNESLNKVISDLELMDEVEGYPFVIQWTSSPEGFIDEKGRLIKGNQKVDEVIELQAVFSYEDWKRDKFFSVHVTKEEANDFLSSLEQQIKVQEADTRKNQQFYLPKVFEDKSLLWRYPPDNTGIVLGILFVFLIPIIAYEKDKEIYSMSQKRKRQLQNSFPEFITKLILLLEAGLSIRSAMFYMVEDYEKVSHKKKMYLYEELSYVCIQIKNGMLEKEGYELLAKRCSLPCYKKISGMLIQHLYKGGDYILEELKSESLKAGEEQKRIMQKKGEEMGTKLLFPMLLMLGIVMVFIMVPALFSFQV